jgi:hypothetical protein
LRSERVLQHPIPVCANKRHSLQLRKNAPFNFSTTSSAREHRCHDRGRARLASVGGSQRRKARRHAPVSAPRRGARCPPLVGILILRIQRRVSPRLPASVAGVSSGAGS